MYINNLLTTKNTMKTKIIISTAPDSYGVTTDENITIVKNRMKDVAVKMGYEIEYQDSDPIRYVTSVEDEISDEHTELIFEVCMECKDLNAIANEKLRAACSSSIESLPFSN